MRYPFGVLWVVFAVLWIASSSTLGHIYDWIVGLPLVLEVIFWIVFLPWVGSLYIWHSDLSLWLRIILIAVVAVATTGGVGAGRTARRQWRDYARGTRV